MQACRESGRCGAWRVTRKAYLQRVQARAVARPSLDGVFHPGADQPARRRSGRRASARRRPAPCGPAGAVSRPRCVPVRPKSCAQQIREEHAPDHARRVARHHYGEDGDLRAVRAPRRRATGEGRRPRAPRARTGPRRRALRFWPHRPRAALGPRRRAASARAVRAAEACAGRPAATRRRYAEVSVQIAARIDPVGAAARQPPPAAPPTAAAARPGASSRAPSRGASPTPKMTTAAWQHTTRRVKHNDPEHRRPGRSPRVAPPSAKPWQPARPLQPGASISAAEQLVRLERHRREGRGRSPRPGTRARPRALPAECRAAPSTDRAGELRRRIPHGRRCPRSSRAPGSAQCR